MKPPPSSPGEGGFLRFSLPYSMKSGGWPEAPIYDRAAPNAIFYIKRDMAIEILIYSRHELPKSMLPHPMNEFRDIPLPPSRCPDRSGEHNQPGKEMGVSGSRFTGTSMAPGDRRSGTGSAVAGGLAPIRTGMGVTKVIPLSAVPICPRASCEARGCWHACSKLGQIVQQIYLLPNRTYKHNL